MFYCLVNIYSILMLTNWPFVDRYGSLWMTWRRNKGCFSLHFGLCWRGRRVTQACPTKGGRWASWSVQRTDIKYITLDDGGNCTCSASVLQQWTPWSANTFTWIFRIFFKGHYLPETRGLCLLKSKLSDNLKKANNWTRKQNHRYGKDIWEAKGIKWIHILGIIWTDMEGLLRISFQQNMGTPFSCKVNKIQLYHFEFFSHMYVTKRMHICSSFVISCDDQFWKNSAVIIANCYLLSKFRVIDLIANCYSSYFLFNQRHLWFRTSRV